MTRALSIYLPKWPIRLALRKRSKQATGRTPDRHEGTVLLLIESTRGKKLVASCCDESEALGVRAGMSLAHAHSLVKNAQVWIDPFTPAEDEKKLHSLARWALRFSPVVAPDPPDGVLIDIRGCEHLFGGEERLVEKIADSLTQLGFPARIAVAPTFACARAVTRFGKRSITFVSTEGVMLALTPLPVSALRINHAICNTLAEMGIQRIGPLLSLPRKELAERFDNELLRAIDHALGRVPETIEPIKTKTLLEVFHVFDGPVTAIAMVLATVRQLLTDITGELKKLQQGFRVLLVELHRVRLEPECVSLELAHPSNHDTHLWSLLYPRLERVHLGYGVEEVLLRAIHTSRITEEQLTLWPNDSRDKKASRSKSFGELLDQLVYRLGEKNVTHAAPVQTYVPEQAFRQVVPSKAQAKGTQHIYRAPRPSHLLPVPQPLRVIALVPDGPPSWLKWQHEEHDIMASVGPERIEHPWWENRTTQTRDYFMVQDKIGRWLWVFRDRESGKWFMHGEWT